ncbi:MAG: hypothetical protein G3M70_05550 [Candidatus Nitronauta litoralis]|uniref:Uncharacterized protein n=1 Tax=Candidatus Nitronauta litoralis TaxID=2705533 RepID=A0A7T0FZN4_9BACT|nr:MAG: hypothetical protein G3M70_05550 [Candidatus Nitronauta litoralis]
MAFVVFILLGVSDYIEGFSWSIAGGIGLIGLLVEPYLWFLVYKENKYEPPAYANLRTDQTKKKP